MSASTDVLWLRRSLFCVSLPLFFITFSLPLQSRALGASALEIGGLFSVFTAVLIALRPVIGAGLDRWGRRPFLLLALFCYVIANLCFALADSLVTLYGARVMQAIGAAVLLITVDTVTVDLVADDDRARAMGRNIEVQTIASIVGATIGFTLVSWPGLSSASSFELWQLTFGVFAVAAMLGLVLAALRVRETRRVAAVSPQVDLALAARMKGFLPIVFAAGFGGALIQPVYLIYLQDRFTLHPAQLAWAFLPSAIVFAVLPSRLAGFTARVGYRRALLLGLSGAALSYGALPFIDDFWPLVGCYTAAAVAWSVADPARKAMTAALSPAGGTGSTFGTVELFVSAGAVAGPILGGVLYDTVSPAAAILLASGVLVLGAIYCINIHRYAIPL